METNKYQNNINPKLEQSLRNTRKFLSNLGSMIGKTICYLQVDNVDLTHKEKEITNSHPRLVEPLKKFMVNTITVTGVEALLIGDDIFVEFNRNAELRAKVEQEPKFFADAADNSIIEEAVNRAITNQTPIFFYDRKKITAEANFRNKQEAAKAEELANSFLEQNRLLSDLIKAQDTSCEEYYRQYGLA